MEFVQNGCLTASVQPIVELSLFQTKQDGRSITGVCLGKYLKPSGFPLLSRIFQSTEKYTPPSKQQFPFSILLDRQALRK